MLQGMRVCEREGSRSGDRIAAHERGRLRADWGWISPKWGICPTARDADADAFFLYFSTLGLGCGWSDPCILRIVKTTDKRSTGTGTMPQANMIRQVQAGEQRAALKRVLVYSHDTFGLGNIRRMLEISRHLVESDPQVSVLIITGSPMLHAFRIPPRIDYVKLPCLARNLQGGYEAKYLDLSPDESIRMRANLIRSTFLDFQPDLILVDKKPFGVRDELASALESLAGRAARPKLVLLLRDILDTPEATTPVWRKNRYYEAIGAYYDEVLVVGAPAVFDLRAEYEFPPLAASKVTYCGYIARTQPYRARAEVRASLALHSDERLVLVTTGGGEDGAALVATYLDCLGREPQGVRPHSLFVCGPDIKPQQRLEIERAGLGRPRVTVHSFADDLMSLMNAADLVVCMGGYNTVCEVLTLHKRAIVVPRVKPVQEQWIRARRMARMGLLRAIHPDELDATRLAATVHEELAALDQPRPALRRLDMDGLANVATAIGRHLHGAKIPALRPQRRQGPTTWKRFQTALAS